MSEEILDVVDERDAVIGRERRSEVHRRGLKHRAVHVLVFNARGELFLQKRARTKDTFPGAWDSSASGHLETGETYAAAAVRELKEELGLAGATPPERLFKLEAGEQTGQEFVWVYRCRADGPFTLPPDEIERGDWFAPAEVTRWLRAEPGAFAPAFPLIWERLWGAPAERNPKPMNPKIVIRSETEADVDAIREVTVAAFKTLAISNHTEPFIIEALRAAKALAVSLVADWDGRVLGHIAFSPVTISDGTRGWYGLGPVSVLPAYQRQGIGQALIREGLSRLRAMQARGCCLVGHPDYYWKFGFENVPGLVHEGVPPEEFFALSFAGRYPQGTVVFHEGFQATGPGGRQPR